MNASTFEIEQQKTSNSQWSYVSELENETIILSTFFPEINGPPALHSL